MTEMLKLLFFFKKNLSWPFRERRCLFGDDSVFSNVFSNLRYYVQTSGVSYCTNL